MTTRDMKEVMDRCRRMETRLTRFLELQGFDTQTAKPMWQADGVIHIPSPATSLKDCLAVIPETWVRGDVIQIQHRGEVLCEVTRP